ncbi:probable pectinesterase/pectinesterase inhibitor 41 [Chenopodium quinoa]|uniref:Pectinesterase n=1 Tax=Chenopodium quinoa TaxID=63459 RepID=A0A803M9H8_CHEQI|nr:probable pectinesterase/pectinesterase inhibitor 41 [Chenopodium quinoa]
MTLYHPSFLVTLSSILLAVHLVATHTNSLPLPPSTPLNPNNATAPVSASTVCQSTQYPAYCKNILQSGNNTTGNVYEYGRFSFKRSVSQASKFLKLINKYLHNSRKLKLTPSAIGALQDCQFLAELNVDFLNTSYNAVNTRENKTLSYTTADDVQTFLSGILTNLQTCLDGVKSAESAWSFDRGITSPLSSDTKLYSISLTLFTKAWIPKKKKGSNPRGKNHKGFFGGGGGGRIPGLKMSENARAVFEASLSRRHERLLASNNDDDDQVNIYDVVTVSQDGSGNFSTINDAVAAAPNKTEESDGYYLIYVTAGVYDEIVSIDKKKRYIMMIGDGINQTIITGNRSVVDNFTTFQSATFAVTGTGFVGMNLTIRNTAGAIKHQAVALRSGADLSAFYSCSFEGYQDTLYVHSLRQFYRECDIYGTVDFIFGNANVVFQNCNIYPRLPLDKQFNAITAQGRTDPNQNTGIAINNCVIRAADDLASSNGTTKTYLGRPWKEYSRTVYLESYIDNVVDPAGWREWDGNFALDTLYYGEFNNSGPSSNVTNRVNWAGYHVMNVTDAINFTVSTFVFGDEWLPQTGVPYMSGLL